MTTSYLNVFCIRAPPPGGQRPQPSHILATPRDRISHRSFVTSCLSSLNCRHGTWTTPTLAHLATCRVEYQWSTPIGVVLACYLPWKSPPRGALFTPQLACMLRDHWLHNWSPNYPTLLQSMILALIHKAFPSNGVAMRSNNVSNQFFLCVRLWVRALPIEMLVVIYACMLAGEGLAAGHRGHHHGWKHHKCGALLTFS